jgi:pimeloyl-ACP methyl ester carboxylesterase
MPTAQTNGINIYYEIHGQGDPFLIIAGLATDVTQLETMVLDLSEKHMVIAFDIRGVVRTDKTWRPSSTEINSAQLHSPSVRGRALAAGVPRLLLLTTIT